MLRAYIDEQKAKLGILLAPKIWYSTKTFSWNFTHLDLTYLKYLIHNYPFNPQSYNNRPLKKVESLIKMFYKNLFTPYFLIISNLRALFSRIFLKKWYEQWVWIWNALSLLYVFPCKLNIIQQFHHKMYLHKHLKEGGW